AYTGEQIPDGSGGFTYPVKTASIALGVRTVLALTTSWGEDTTAPSPGNVVHVTSTVTNPNPFAIHGVAFNMHIPDGYLVASNPQPPACSGVFGLLENGVIPLNNITVPANGSCSYTFGFRYFGSLVGTLTTTSDSLTSTELGAQVNTVSDTI